MKVMVPVCALGRVRLEEWGKFTVEFERPSGISWNVDYVADPLSHLDWELSELFRH